MSFPIRQRGKIRGNLGKYSARQYQYQQQRKRIFHGFPNQ